MENLSKRILALLFAVVIIFPLVTTPVFALGEPTAGFWEWIPGFTPGGSFGGGGGRGDIAKEDYKKYVQTLPASGYTSDGGLIWYPTFGDVSSLLVYIPNSSSSSWSLSELPATFTSARCSFSYELVSSSCIRQSYVGSESTVSLKRVGFYTLRFKAPISGSYAMLSSTAFSYRYVTNDGSIVSDKVSWLSHPYEHVNQGAVFSADRYVDRYLEIDASYSTSSSFLMYFPHFQIIPDSSIAPAPGEDYSAETRPTSITGDYGIVGDNGEVTVVNGNILDETGKTIYNPVTNTTTNFESWQYDYSTRTYTVTLSTGDTQTITYGDEYVTIQEGDTVYNVYYIVQGGGGTPVDPDTCQHTYTSTTDREPTCTVPGSKTLTCSKCGNVTTEAIPAKGHTWTVLQTVQTSYDENGQLVQQGYTIYQCSVCGEQYKDVNGTGPPGGQEEEKKSIWEKIGDLIGSVAGGFITIIETALGKVLDYLIALVEGINAKLESVVNSIFGLFDRIPQLFGGFTGFLTAVFPFLPQEFFDILIFTLLVICAAAIIRFLWKR